MLHVLWFVQSDPYLGNLPTINTLYSVVYLIRSLSRWPTQISHNSLCSVVCPTISLSWSLTHNASCSAVCPFWPLSWSWGHPGSFWLCACGTTLAGGCCWPSPESPPTENSNILLNIIITWTVMNMICRVHCTFIFPYQETVLFPNASSQFKSSINHWTGHECIFIIIISYLMPVSIYFFSL